MVGLQVTEALAAADGTSRGVELRRASLTSCKLGQFLNEEASYGSVSICSQKSGEQNHKITPGLHTGLSQPVLPCKDVSVFPPMASSRAWKSVGLRACGEENGTCLFPQAGLGCSSYNQPGRGL